MPNAQVPPQSAAPVIAAPAPAPVTAPALAPPAPAAPADARTELTSVSATLTLPPGARIFDDTYIDENHEEQSIVRITIDGFELIVVSQGARCERRIGLGRARRRLGSKGVRRVRDEASPGGYLLVHESPSLALVETCRDGVVAQATVTVPGDLERALRICTSVEPVATP